VFNHLDRWLALLFGGGLVGCFNGGVPFFLSSLLPVWNPTFDAPAILPAPSKRLPASPVLTTRTKLALFGTIPLSMNENLKRFLGINFVQFGGNKTLMRGGATLLEMWVKAAESGKFGDRYTRDDIERTRRRVADIRSVTIGGSSEKAPLN